MCQKTGPISAIPLKDEFMRPACVGAIPGGSPTRRPKAASQPRAASIWNPRSDGEKAIYEKFFGNFSEARRVQILNDQQRYDYGSYDTFAEAVRYGHEIGLKIDAWVT